MHRLDNGQPIRDAIHAAGLSIERLAEMTKRSDPAGYGISQSAIGHMVSTGRDSFTARSADLVARALGVSVEELFTNTPA